MKLAALLSILGLLAFARPAGAAEVGFSELRIANGAAAPLVIGVWYPTRTPAQVVRLGPFMQEVARDGAVAGRRLPLVVVSHGNGGSYQNHYDTAIALAKAGFVVAAVSHTGDTQEDQSRASFLMDRPKHIRRLIDYMLGEWPGHERIAARRIGIFGFSSGGATALVSVGGAPDLSLIDAHAKAHPGYYDARLAQRLTPENRAELQATLRSGAPWVQDRRIRAAVVAAPALGYTFGAEGLKTVSVPIQLWRAEKDQILPHPDYAEAVRLALPRPPEFHLVENGDHFDFLAPCSDLLRRVAPQICVSHPGFDRAGFHQTFNQQVVRFFRRTL